MARRPLKRALCLRMTCSSFTVSAVYCPVSVIPPRVPTLRREEATLLSQAEQAGHASANDTHTQPFWAELPMGCEEDSSPRSGSRGSSLARFHDSRIKTRGCTAAFRALLRMAERMHPGQLHTPCSSPPFRHDSTGLWKQPCHPRINSSSSF